MVVAVYLRKSRAEEQATVADTLARHKSILLAYADSKGYVVDGIYEEVVSGESIYNRPQMQALLADVQDERYDGVLCMDIDRLGRGGMRDQGLILDTFRLSGTLIITPDKVYDLSDDIDEELTEFRAFFSRQEYRSIKKRLQRGLQKSIEEGCYVGPPPYGYTRVYQGKKPTLAIHTEEAEIVRAIFDWYLDGSGTATIADRLNQLGIPPHRSDRWNRSSVARILHNPAYAGKVVWNRTKHIRKGSNGSTRHAVKYMPADQWTITEGMHPAIISEEQYNKVQELFSRRYIPSQRKSDTLQNPLAGLIYCQKCGAPMQRQAPAGKKAYLLCQRPGCVASAQFDLVEAALLENIRSQLAVIESEIAAGQDGSDLTVYQSAAKEIENQIRVSQSQKDRLHDLLEQGVYDVETYRQRMSLLEGKISDLQTQEDNIKAKIAKASKQDKRALAAKIRSALDVYHTSDAMRRNMLLKSIVDHATYFKAKKSAPNDFTLAVALRR